MRRLPIIVCLWTLACGSARADAGQRRAPGSGMPLPQIESVAQRRVEALETWLKAVARHLPGEDDEPLKEMAGGPNAT